MLALRAVAKATWSRFARLKPPSEVLILFYYRRKKTCFKKQVFQMWSAREDDAHLRCLPCGPLLTQRGLAALGSNLLRRFSSSFTTDEKKPALKSRFFKYGRRERIRTSDPLVPNQLRYQAALLAEWGASYCDPLRASTAFYNIRTDCP